jgi:hypothetical protein
MVVGTHTLPDLQSACAEAKVLHERLKVAARRLNVWLLIVFELVFLAETSCADLRANSFGRTQALILFHMGLRTPRGCPPLKSLGGGLHEISR